jgi:hypothetical protein
LPNRNAFIRKGGITYAISHASAALVFKRKYPRVGLWPLLIAVQFVELLWIVFTYLGIEHVRITGDHVHLDFLPYSHSVFTGAFLAALAWGAGKLVRRSNVGAAIALAILSHIVLDIIHHEPNIALLPIAWGPRLGMNLQGYPLFDIIVELVFCVACWKLFGGSKGLLIGIVIFNLLNIPLMFPRPGTGAMLAQHPSLLPTIILIQVVSSWLLVWLLARGTLVHEEPRIPTPV